MEFNDDDLIKFEAQGAGPLPDTKDQGYIEHDGARIWYLSYGAGSPMILLHGGLGHSGNWGYQVPDLVASDVLAVMDALHIEKAALVGWSDGACTALVLASKFPERAADVFFFACNMDPSGVKEIEFTPTIKRCFNQHVKNYQSLSPTPDQFDEFAEAVGLMQKTQPDYSAEDLAKISVPVAIVQSEHDEFIKREHAEYLAQSIPNAEFIFLSGVSHFAPL